MDHPFKGGKKGRTVRERKQGVKREGTRSLLHKGGSGAAGVGRKTEEVKANVKAWGEEAISSFSR